MAITRGDRQFAAHQGRSLQLPQRRCVASSVKCHLLLAALLMLLASVARGELRADQLLLVVNSKVAPGVELARYYAQQRRVPEDHILSVDVPATDDIALDEYELA